MRSANQVANPLALNLADVSRRYARLAQAQQHALPQERLDGLLDYFTESLEELSPPDRTRLSQTVAKLSHRLDAKALERVLAQASLALTHPIPGPVPLVLGAMLSVDPLPEVAIPVILDGLGPQAASQLDKLPLAAGPTAARYFLENGESPREARLFLEAGLKFEEALPSFVGALSQVIRQQLDPEKGLLSTLAGVVRGRPGLTQEVAQFLGGRPEQALSRAGRCLDWIAKNWEGPELRLGGVAETALESLADHGRLKPDFLIQALGPRLAEVYVDSLPDSVGTLREAEEFVGNLLRVQAEQGTSQAGIAPSIHYLRAAALKCGPAAPVTVNKLLSLGSRWASESGAEAAALTEAVAGTLSAWGGAGHFGLPAGDLREHLAQGHLVFQNGGLESAATPLQEQSELLWQALSRGQKVGDEIVARPELVGDLLTLWEHPGSDVSTLRPLLAEAQERQKLADLLEPHKERWMAFPERLSRRLDRREQIAEAWDVQEDLLKLFPDDFDPKRHRQLVEAAPEAVLSELPPSLHRILYSQPESLQPTFEGAFAEGGRFVDGYGMLQLVQTLDEYGWNPEPGSLERVGQHLSGPDKFLDEEWLEALDFLIEGEPGGDQVRRQVFERALQGRVSLAPHEFFQRSSEQDAWLQNRVSDATSEAELLTLYHHLKEDEGRDRLEEVALEMPPSDSRSEAFTRWNDDLRERRVRPLLEQLERSTDLEERVALVDRSMSLVGGMERARQTYQERLLEALAPELPESAVQDWIEQLEAGQECSPARALLLERHTRDHPLRDRFRTALLPLTSLPREFSGRQLLRETLDSLAREQRRAEEGQAFEQALAAVLQSREPGAFKNRLSGFVFELKEIAREVSETEWLHHLETALDGRVKPAWVDLSRPAADFQECLMGLVLAKDAKERRAYLELQRPRIEDQSLAGAVWSPSKGARKNYLEEVLEKSDRHFLQDPKVPFTRKVELIDELQRKQDQNVFLKLRPKKAIHFLQQSQRDAGGWRATVADTFAQEALYFEAGRWFDELESEQLKVSHSHLLKLVELTGDAEEAFRRTQSARALIDNEGRSSKEALEQQLRELVGDEGALGSVEVVWTDDGIQVGDSWLELGRE